MNTSLYPAVAVAIFVSSLLPAATTAQEVTRELLLKTLDNAQAIVTARPEMFPAATYLHLQIDKARAQVLSAAPGELVIPDSSITPLMMFEMATGGIAKSLRRVVQPEGAKMSSPSAEVLSVEGTAGTYDGNPLDDPEYPDIAWTFGWDKVDIFINSGDENTSGTQAGVCLAHGYAPEDRFATLTISIAAEAVADIGRAICNETILGENLSALCIVLEVVRSIEAGLMAMMSLCDDVNTSAEVSATWTGLGKVHGNVQQVYEKLILIDQKIDELDRKIAILDARSIEHNVAQRHRIVSLMLPEGEGGHAEDVRDIVAARIQDCSLKGACTAHVDRAQGLLQKGQGELNAGRYDRAYRAFWSAYKSLGKAEFGMTVSAVEPATITGDTLP